MQPLLALQCACHYVLLAPVIKAGRCLLQKHAAWHQRLAFEAPSNSGWHKFTVFEGCAVSVDLLTASTPSPQPTENYCCPRFQERCHPSDLNTRGLEDMTNASLQRGR